MAAQRKYPKELRERAVWLGWIAAVIAAAALIGPIGFVESPVEPVMDALGFGSKIAFHFWILLASIVLTVRLGRSSASEPISRKVDSAGVQATS
jgi:predicted tellurium resistance membrane protein TerC